MAMPRSANGRKAASSADARARAASAMPAASRVRPQQSSPPSAARATCTA